MHLSSLVVSASFPFPHRVRSGYPRAAVGFSAKNEREKYKC